MAGFLGNKHVLVIGIDGLRPDCLKKAKTPAMDDLIAHGIVTYNAYAGGEIDTPTQQATSSGPGWSSILTGVWANKHNVPNNDFSDPNYAQYPHFFTRIKETVHNAILASIVQWSPINEHIVPKIDTDYMAVGDGTEVPDLATKYLTKHNPDVVFIHFDDVDHTGHKYGYGPEIKDYLKAIEKVDQSINDIIGSVKKRPNYDKENWLTIVTTDHGGINKGHGGQTPEERTIFIIISGYNALKGTIANGPGHTAVVPTIFKFLEIPILPEWGWESKPFGLKSK